MRDLPFPNSKWTWTPLSPLDSDWGLIVLVQAQDDLAITERQYWELLQAKLEWQILGQDDPKETMRFLVKHLSPHLYPAEETDPNDLQYLVAENPNMRDFLNRLMGDQAETTWKFPARPVNDPEMLRILESEKDSLEVWGDLGILAETY